MASGKRVLRARLEKNFTKSIMTVVVLLYFVGALLGGILTIAAAIVDVRLGEPINSQMFIAYAAYIGGPTATAIGFYAWKSKAENILKIQKQNEPLAVALTTMEGE